MSFGVFVVDVFNVVTCHKFVRGAGKTYAAPVMAARQGVSAGKSRGWRTIPCAMLHVDRRSKESAEVRLPPAACAQPHARETIRKNLSEMIRAESAHGMSAKENAISVDLEALRRRFYCSIDAT